MRDEKWWKSGVIYQVYPRSFKDTNGDGVGDLRGITEKLDYLAWIGVDAVWISPIYPSPMADFGYDISNYTDIHPMFGTLDDFDELVSEAHARGLKVILDYVPNHTSDEHPWFEESRSSRDNPKRDWYVWRDPKPDGSPPNNWASYFGGGAWEWDEGAGQYYLHLFDRKQADHNRDPARTPMQWTSGLNAGFCPEDAEPWLPVAEDHESVNVEAQRDDPNSHLTLFRRLIGLRRESSALRSGSYEPLDSPDDCLVYVRRHADGNVVVALNFSGEEKEVALPRDAGGRRVALSTRLDRDEEIAGSVTLRPREGVMIA